MKRKLLAALFPVLMFMLLTACSGGTNIDFSNVELVKLTISNAGNAD
ncbi:MAG: hypothetical protein QMB62_08290 [Oscillospiraceae bacterium]